MFEQPSVRVHRLAYSVRGPEWGFAIPQGDLGALVDVVRSCSDFWNGIGSLLIPVRADGRLYPELDRLLDTRDVDTVYLHPRLGDRARRAIAKRFSKTSGLHDHLTRHEIHPLFLAINNNPDTVGTLWRPRFENKRLKRIADAVWGWIDDDDLPEWRSRFTVADVGGEPALDRMLRGQIAGNTPLQLSGRLMDTFEQSSIDGWRHLFVFERGSFDELVYFWNLRARMRTWAGEHLVIAVTREQLVPGGLQPVKEWAESANAGTYFKPDVCLAGPERAMPAAQQALEELGFKRSEPPFKYRHSFPDPPEGQEDLEYTEFPIGVGGPLRRGINSSTLVTVTDRIAHLDLPRPVDQQLPFGFVRVAVRGLPLPLPLNSVTAEKLIPNAKSSQDGLTVVTASGYRRWSWEIRLPNPTEALDQWANAHDYEAISSQPGLYAQALLARLQGPNALDALAEEVALDLLDALAPPRSTRKLAQRLRAELGAEVNPLNEELLVEVLLDQGLLLTSEGKTLNEIASRTGRPEGKHLPALDALVGAGLVRRGVGLRCSHCKYKQLIAINDLDERIECMACRHVQVLPVVRGDVEHPISYFLDGLAARLVEQDLLPVVLSLRKAKAEMGEGSAFFAWPGLLFRRRRVEVDADLLVSNGAKVSIFECKTTAEGLRLEQTKKLLDLSAALAARPGIAAMNGRFSPEVIEAVQEANGIVYERADLVASF